MALKYVFSQKSETILVYNHFIHRKEKVKYSFLKKRK
jgi:hypothetical protein